MSREGTEVLVIWPPDEASIVAFGAPKLVVLVRLKNSARNDSTLSRGMAKFLKTEPSYWRKRSVRSVSART